MVKKADLPKEIIETALRLAAETGWRDLSLAAIAAAAKLPLAKVYPVFSSKQAILNAFTRRIDAEVLATEEPEAGEGRA
ncbi:MAG: TetR family transcriptional regulator, partial [Kiloniellales bacterium]